MVRFFFGDLKIGSASQNSGVFSGENMQSGWACRSKVNEGLGSISGDKNVSSENRQIVNDADTVESYRRTRQKPYVRF